MRLKARRPFWGDSNIGDPRRIIKRGETFETKDYHAQQLIARKIAEPVQDLEPENTQDMQPAEQPTFGPNVTPTVDATETKDAPEPQEPTQEPPDEFTDLTVKELKTMAKGLKIKGYSDMNGKQLKSAIKAAKGENNHG